MHKKSDKIPRGNTAAIQHLLNIFFGLNVLQLLSIIMLAGLQRRQDIAAALAAAMYRRTASNSREASTDGRRKSPDTRTHSTAIEEQPLLGDSHRRYSSSASQIRLSRDEVEARKEQKRGEVFVAICASLIIFAWVLFLGTAWFRLGKKNGSK